jgi:hypothetical protein
MYKGARGLRRDDSPDPKPRPRAYWRVIYYSAIAHDKRRFPVHHKTAPDWLKNEVTRFTPVKWLNYWDEKTGKPKAPTRIRVRTSQQSGG